MPLHRTLWLQVAAAIIAGIIIGYLWPSAGVALKPFADAFVKIVKMMVTPVVFCTIVLGIAGMRSTRTIGRTLLKAMGLFYLLTAIALLIGLAVAYALAPGVGMNVDPAQLDASVVAQYGQQAAPRGFVEFVLGIIPHSFFGAFAQGSILSVLLLAILIGTALTRAGAAGEPLLRGIDSFCQVLFLSFGFIIKLSPLGALGAMAFTVGRYGIASLSSLALLVSTFYIGCIFFIVVVLGTLARLYQFSLSRLIRYFREELLVILGTSTSEAVLPRLLRKLEALGCEKRVVSMALPLSYSFNLDGTAIFLAVASLFIAQACNIQLSLMQLLSMLLVMLLTSKGAAGVAGSGFVALIATLTVMRDIPVAGVTLIIGVDRFLSAGRAVTSTISNAVATIVIANWEQACDRATLQAELARSQPVP